MSIQEAAKDLNNMFKEERKNSEIESLKEKIDTLEKVIMNLTDRLEYLESRCR